MTGPQFDPEAIQRAVAQYQGANAPQQSPQAAVPAPVEQTPAAPAQEPPQPVAPVVEEPPATPEQAYQAAVEQHAQAVGEVSPELEAANTAADVLAKQHLAETARLAEQQAADLDDHKRAAAAAETEARALGEKAGAMRVVDRRTTGQKTMGLFALLMSGAADGAAQLGGNRDTRHVDDMAKLLNEQVEKDMEQQREERTQVQGRARDKWSEAALAHQHYGDTLHAQSAHMGMLQAKYAAATEQIAAASANPVLKQRAAVAAAQLKDEAAKNLMSAHDARTLELQREMAAERRARIAASAGFQRAQVAAADSPKQLTRVELEALEQSGQLTGPQGQQLNYIRQAGSTGTKQGEAAFDQSTDPVRVASKKGGRLSQDLVVEDPEIAPLHAKGAEKMQAGADSARIIVKAIDEAIRIRSEHPFKSAIWGTDARGQLQSVGTSIKLNSKNLFDLGALSGPDIGLVEGIAGDPANILSVNEAKLKELRSSIESGVKDKFESRGFRAPQLTEPAARPKAPQGAPGKGSVPSPSRAVPSGKVRVRRASDGATGMMDANDPAVKSGKYEVL